MNGATRRGFLADVGRGMFVASLGPALAADLGLASAAEGEPEPGRLTFGDLEPLVSVLQETPADRLLPELVNRLSTGTDLRQLTAAAALANARAFGGEHYRGYHAFMAIAPAFQMARDCPAPRRALPVLKVLHRNTEFIQSTGGGDVLHPIEAADLADSPAAGTLLREASAAGNVEQAEHVFAAMAEQSPEEMFNDVLEFNVEDHASVHEVVLVWRAWSLLDLTGREHAHTLLRQSIRQCIDRSAGDYVPDPRRALMVRLLDEHGLATAPQGRREADEHWIESLCDTILSSKPDQAAEAVAAALAEGFRREDVGEALSLAANQLVLRQVENWEGEHGHGRRTHGDSPGVHSSDAVNAWRNIARVGSPRSAAAALILAGHFVASMHCPAGHPRGTGHGGVPFPHADQIAQVTATNAESLLKELDGAVRENDQLRACAIAERYGSLGHNDRSLRDALLRFTISEDGRLHGEKYYRTVSEEYAAARPAFRRRQLTALARVTASAYGLGLEDERLGHAPAYEEA
ncbi:MAG: hypothetical protein WBC44_20400, partial [Planctomycetaceae bacterium]